MQEPTDQPTADHGATAAGAEASPRKRPKPGERRVQILQALASMLARKARRPVKLQYSREEEIIDSNTRFETKIYVRIGVKKDMTLHALHVKAYINQGAYHVRLGGLGNQATVAGRIDVASATRKMQGLPHFTQHGSVGADRRHDFHRA